MSETQPAKYPASAYVQAAVFAAIILVALFASAGTLAIPDFWIYVAIWAAVFVASFVMVDPDLARERMRPGGQRLAAPLWVFTGVMILHWVIAGLDRGRFHWSDTVPAWLRAVGLVAVAAAYMLTLWAMHENRFFSSVVRIQSDRGQHVISSGPYAYIRHPGYLAGTVLIVFSGIALGSWLAAVFLIVTSVPFLMHRAITEDRTLQAELPGYRDYAARVRWRIVPEIW